MRDRGYDEASFPQKMTENGATYRFGEVEVDAVRGTLTRNGEKVYLRPKTFQVLAYLIKNRGVDLKKDDIIRDVWHDTAVVDDVLVQSIKDIRRALNDDTREPRFVRTIPKVGYRFLPETDDMPNGKDMLQADVVIPPPRYLIALGIIVVLGILAALSFRLAWNSTDDIRVAQTPGKRSVLVMFFDNQSQQEELGWLREGLADMMIAGLARSPNLTVISRLQLHVLLDRYGSATEKSISLPQALEIARRSGSETLIAGTFSRLGDKIRVEAQAYKSADGELLASEALTVSKPEEILTEIDLIILKISRKLGGTGPDSNAGVVRSMTDNLAAYRYYSLAVEKAHALHSEEAIALLEKATSLDPEFAMAHARIGYTYAVSAGLAEKGKPPLERAFRLSDRLTELDRLYITAWYAIANLDYPGAIVSLQELILKYPLETEAYWRTGRLLLGEERYEDAIAVLRQGLSIDPDDRNIYNALSATYRDSNRHSEAVSMAERYVLLAPNEPNALDTLALAQQAAGNYAAAAENYEKAIAMSPGFGVAVLHNANLLFQTGRYRDAEKYYLRYLNAADSDADRAWARARIAWVRWRMGDAPAARTNAQLALKLDSGAFEIPLLIAIEGKDAAEVERLRSRLETHAAYSERGLRPSQRSAFALRGKLALYDNDVSGAVTLFARAITHRPLFWDIEPLEDCLASAHLAAGMATEAASEYERVLSLNPNYPRAAFHLGQAYERAGEPAKAVESYRRFLGTWKNADSDLEEIGIARRSISE